MATLADYVLNRRSRTPTARCFLGSPTRGIPAQPVQLADVAGTITIAQNFGQPIAGGTVTLRNPPFTPQIKDTVYIEWGYSWQHVPAFTGFVTDPGHKSYPNTWTLQIKDILWLADFTAPSNTPITFDPPNNLTATEVLTRLLRDWAGIPASRIALPVLEQQPGVPWMLGTLTPIEFQGSPLQACQQICSPLGYWLFADAAGTVRAVQMSGAPTSQPFRTIQDGRDHLVNGAPEVVGSADNIYNRIIVTGANTGVQNVQIKDAYQVDHPLLPPGKFREKTFNFPLIEYQNASQSGAASCEAVAKRLTAEYSRTPAAVRGRIKADPRFQVGMTLAFQCDRLHYPTAMPFFLYGLQTTWGGADFSQQYVLDGGIGQDGYTTIPPPLAAFTVKLMTETLNGVGVVEVFVDGSASTSLGGGEIVAWAWTDDSVPPQTASGVRTMLLYPAAQLLATITLTVTDTNGKQATVSQTVNLQGDLIGPPANRTLSFAAGNTWYVTPNGGKQWNKVSGEATITVPPISAAGSAVADRTTAETVGLIATGGTGASIRATADNLLTPPETRGTLPGQARFLWQHERDPQLIVAAVGDGVYRSTDSGATWALAGRPATGHTVTSVLISVDDPNIIDALAGHQLYTSFDGGATWASQLEGPEEATARCYALGFARRWVGFTGCPTGASPLRSAEGDIAAFPPVTPEVTNIRALTMLVDEPTLIAIDDAGRIWRLNAEDGGEAAQIATMPSVEVA